MSAKIIKKNNNNINNDLMNEMPVSNAATNRRHQAGFPLVNYFEVYVQRARRPKALKS